MNKAALTLLREKNLAIHGLLENVKDIAPSGAKWYLAYMAVRLLEMHRVLKDTGSVYLHCDPTMSHYLKLVLDAIFGCQNFRNEIIWGYRTQGVSKKRWPRKHDIIFLYSKANEYTYSATMELQYYSKPFRHTKIDKEGRYYISTYLRDVWDHDETKPTISQSPERTGYPTQKPVKLLERIILASSREKDLVLDPFCGCATTCIAAERHGRKWVGIDVSPKAYELVQKRLNKEVAREDELFTLPVHFREDFLQRDDVVYLKLYGKHKTEEKRRMYGEQEGKCNGCKDHFKIVHLEIDHITPKNMGGGDNKDNLQLLCGYCNKIKGKRKMEYLLAALEKK